MAETRPRGEQLRFVSSKTGSHILDDYLEAVEQGTRRLDDMIADLFDTEGVFRHDIFEFREDPADAGKLQVRVGQFVNANTGWQTMSFTDFSQYVTDCETAQSAASANMTSSGIFANASSIAADNAASSATTASQWASAAGEIPGTQEYSAKYWATSANVGIVAGLESEIQALGPIAANITTVAGINTTEMTAIANAAANLATISGLSAEIGLLGATATAAAITTLGTSSNITLMNNVHGVSTQLSLLGTAANASAIGLLGVEAHTAATTGSLAVLSGIVPTLTALNNVSSEIGSLGVSTHTDLTTGTLVKLNAIESDISTVAALPATDISNLSSQTIAIQLLGTSANATAIGNLGPIAANITTVAGINTTNLSSVAGVATEIGNLGQASVVQDMNLLGTTAMCNTSNGYLQTLAAVSTDITTVAGINTTHLSNVSGVATEVAALDTIYAELESLGAEIFEIQQLGTAAMTANMSSLALIVAELERLGHVDNAGWEDSSGSMTGGHLTLLGTSQHSDPTTGTLASLAAITSDITDVAAELSALQLFDDYYKRQSTEPPLVAGTWWFDTSINRLKFYKVTPSSTTWETLLLVPDSSAAATGDVLTRGSTGNSHSWQAPFDNGGGNLTAKGDLETFTTSQTRLAVGTNGHVLTADSTTAAGIKWAAVSGGGGITTGKSIAMAMIFG